MRTWTRNLTLCFLTTMLYSVASRSSSAQTTDSASAPSRTPSTRSTSSPQTSLPKELEGKVTMMKRGQRAPTGGILMTRVTLAHLLTESNRRIRVAVAAAQLAVKNATTRVFAAEKRTAAKVEAAKSSTEACLSDAVRRERIYESALARGRPTSFWRSPLVVGVLGAVVGGGICVGASAASR